MAKKNPVDILFKRVRNVEDCVDAIYDYHRRNNRNWENLNKDAKKWSRNIHILAEENKQIWKSLRWLSMSVLVYEIADLWGDVATSRQIDRLEKRVAELEKRVEQDEMDVYKNPNIE